MVEVVQEQRRVVALSTLVEAVPVVGLLMVTLVLIQIQVEVLVVLEAVLNLVKMVKKAAAAAAQEIGVVLLTPVLEEVEV